jgi:hypothetical protein
MRGLLCRFTQIESVVEPDSVGDDIGRESMAFVGIHRLIVPTMVTLLVSTLHP